MRIDAVSRKAIEGSPSALGLSPNRELLAVACDDGDIHLLNFPDMDLVLKFSYEEADEMHAVTFSPCGNLLAVGSR